MQQIMAQQGGGQVQPSRYPAIYFACAAYNMMVGFATVLRTLFVWHAKEGYGGGQMTEEQQQQQVRPVQSTAALCMTFSPNQNVSIQCSECFDRKSSSKLQRSAGRPCSMLFCIPLQGRDVSFTLSTVGLLCHKLVARQL